MRNLERLKAAGALGEPHFVDTREALRELAEVIAGIAQNVPNARGLDRDDSRQPREELLGLARWLVTPGRGRQWYVGQIARRRG